MASTIRKSNSGKDAPKPPAKSPRSRRERRKPQRETLAIYNYRVLKKVRCPASWWFLAEVSNDHGGFLAYLLAVWERLCQN
jgi:hypothetical protein